MESRLGDVLVNKGVLNAGQVDRVLAEQGRTGEPFGVLCERLYNVHPRDVEAAWGEQYARLTMRIDPATECFDPAVQGMINRRQAWQFGCLPVRWDGAEVMVATCEENLVRAHRFCLRTLSASVFLVLCEAEDLVTALHRWYPLPGAKAA
ncbi:MAG: hypothetical protein MK101_09475 [Phycisphaerales bacterium]|nr:hypothetical protein [Phycisphaerales bacterium]